MKTYAAKDVTLLLDGKKVEAVGDVDYREISDAPFKALYETNQRLADAVRDVTLTNYAAQPAPAAFGGLPMATSPIIQPPRVTKRTVRPQLMPWLTVGSLDEHCQQLWRCIEKTCETFEVCVEDLPIQGIQIGQSGTVLLTTIMMSVSHRDRGPDYRVPLLGHGRAAWAARAATDDACLDWISSMLRDHIHKMILHEVDECLYVDGTRKWDPHRGEFFMRIASG